MHVIVAYNSLFLIHFHFYFYLLLGSQIARSIMAAQAKAVRVAVVGVGLVGSEFVNQLLALPSEMFRLVSLSTSRATLFSADGLAVNSLNWRPTFEKAAGPTILSALIGELQSIVDSGSKAVLVDNTSADTVAKLYPQFLSAGINVITPNKKAFSSDQSLYDAIVNSSISSGAKFLNESTVGAGLPVISTLKDLVATGDTVSQVFTKP